jgi:hypothetical protein
MIQSCASIDISKVYQGRVRLTKGAYGSVPKVYVVCTEDHAVAEGFQGFQRLMVENNPVDEVKEIAADQMVMLSRPDELVRYLTDIADKYA